jgi:hypothetical protein
MGARAIIRNWMDSRAKGSTDPLITQGAIASKRIRERRDAVEEHQLITWSKAGYPVEASAHAMGLAVSTVESRTRKLLGPLKRPKHHGRRDWNKADAKKRQARAFAGQKMPRRTIGLILDLNDKQVSEAVAAA